MRGLFVKLKLLYKGKIPMEVSMKKAFIIICMAGFLAACGSTSEKSGSAKSKKDNTGSYATADITVKGDDVVSIKLDEIKEGKSKMELGTKYGMKTASPIKKEWNEQAKFLEDYIKENGLDKVELNSKGYPTNEDVLTGCTMNIKNMIDAANAAKDKAK